MDENRRHGSLFLTRVMACALILSLGGWYWGNRQLNAVLEKLSSHAHQVYPYLPILDRHFDFNVDFYGEYKTYLTIPSPFLIMFL